MSENLYKKVLLYGIVFLFIGASIIPNISGNDGKTINQSSEKKVINFPLNNDYLNAYWRFNDCSGTTLTDSAHSYDGTIYGASWVGSSDCELYFDGINDYVDLTDHVEELGFNKTDDWILTLTLRTTDDDGGIIYSSTGINNIPEYRIQINPNGTLSFKMWTALCGIQLFSNSVINDDDYYDVKIIFNGITTDPTVELYVDDVLDSSITRWLCEIENDDFLKATMGKRASDETLYYDGYLDDFKIIKYEEGNKQDPPEISGPTLGQPNIEYDYSFITYDPEEDDISLYIDWDDGTVDELPGPYSPGEEVIVSHTFTEEGTFDIRAKSIDFWDDSAWSYHLVRIGNQAPDKPTISGQRYGNSQQEITYTFLTKDFENENLKYIIEWDDGTTSETNFVPSNTSVEVSHSWNTNGDYNITARGVDINDKEGDKSGYLIRIGDQPPSNPSIYGAVRGIPDTIYEYGFISIDPENDNITYEIDWGDGNIEIDIGPFPSGDIFSRSHSWDTSDNFMIKSRAKDDFGYYSDWSEHQIFVPRAKTFNLNLFEILFERYPNVSLIIKNLLIRGGEFL